MVGKNAPLAYEANEPSFLRKLRNQQAGGDTDRHERQIARPKRAKADAEDDGPTYVDEESNDTYSREEYQALLGVGREKFGDGAFRAPQLTETESHADDRDTIKDSEVVQKAQEIVEVGKSQKKRRVVKMIGADEENEPGSILKDVKKPKKAKSVKLSFAVDSAEK